MKIVGVIPAHLASVRFPRKVLYPFCGLSMVEHVRRRALLSGVLDAVYVATFDQEIANVVKGAGGPVIMTSNAHKTGTDRVAEAVRSLDCTHVIVLQADEPLLLPDTIVACAEAIRGNPEIVAWNAVGPVTAEADLEDRSIVKCIINPQGRILFCCRRSPCLRSSFIEQQSFVRKIFGLIAFRRDFLLKFTQMPEAPFEHAEFIEQSRIIENGVELQSIPITMSYPSVNEAQEVALVERVLASDTCQQRILERVLHY
ncbi:3-deoxy-manno-octulosonate cytidylyltransferase [Candidatus Uhrbacteria bacterium]|nr:3-deoxy-manno-octulosonate cytidylyltransferase [Candidatus Uhrbacteria bacterium]